MANWKQAYLFVAFFLFTLRVAYTKKNKKSYHMFKHVIIGGVMKLVGIEASTNRT